MDSGRWDRLQELLFGALELEPEERSDYLAEACGDDRELLASAHELLEAHLAGGRFDRLVSELVR